MSIVAWIATMNGSLDQARNKDCVSALIYLLSLLLIKTVYLLYLLIFTYMYMYILVSGLPTSSRQLAFLGNWQRINNYDAVSCIHGTSYFWNRATLADTEF